MIGCFPIPIIGEQKVGLQIEKAFFESREQVLEDIGKNNTWPTTFVSGPSEGLPVHWHSEEVHAYIMEGETDFLDVEIDRSEYQSQQAIR